MRLELVVGADTPILSASGWTPHYKYSGNLQTVEQTGAAGSSESRKKEGLCLKTTGQTAYHTS